MPAARADLGDAIDFLASKSPQAARRFVEAAYETLEFLALFPRSGTLYEPLTPRLAGVRWFPVRGFETWLVFYRVTDRVRIERVLYGTRDIPAVLLGPDGLAN